MKSKKLVMLAIAVVVVAASTVEAQSNSGGWQFTIAPYIWGAGVDGSMTIGDDPAIPEVDLNHIIDGLDAGFLGHFNARNERWMISSDLVYVDLGGRRDYEDGTIWAGLDTLFFELDGGYRVSPAVTILAGARLVTLGMNVSVQGPFEDRQAEADKTFVDPIIGVHILAPLSEKWWFGFRGDIGGFGVGSEFSWQAYADIGFRISRVVSVLAGYRVLDMDYQSETAFDPVELDLMISGPQIAVAFTF